jgi:hypothetical protein
MVSMISAATSLKAEVTKPSLCDTRIRETLTLGLYNITFAFLIFITTFISALGIPPEYNGTKIGFTVNSSLDHLGLILSN